MEDSTAPESFVIDINMSLPAALRNEAALAAISERADNAPDPDAKGKLALAVAKNRLWKIGRHLRVHFLDAADYPPRRVEMVMEAANKWTKHANLVFEVSNDPTAELRVSFNPNSGCSSYIGTDALLIASPEPTIKLSVMGEQELRPDYHKYVLHEFGHAIGCIHEHSTPIAGIRWNRPVVYEFYFKHYKWEQPTVNYNVFSICEEASSNHVYPRDQKIDPRIPIVTEHSATFDPDSIMVYPIPKDHTLDGYEVKWRDNLSSLDISFIADMYPYPRE